MKKSSQSEGDRKWTGCRLCEGFRTQQYTVLIKTEGRIRRTTRKCCNCWDAADLFILLSYFWVILFLCDILSVLCFAAALIKRVFNSDIWVGSVMLTLSLALFVVVVKSVSCNASGVCQNNIELFRNRFGGICPKNCPHDDEDDEDMCFNPTKHALKLSAQKLLGRLQNVINYLIN